jgi:hypothetical protein
VSTFIQRNRTLEKDDTASQEALAMLRGRGLTEEVLKHAEAMLKQFERGKALRAGSRLGGAAL